MAAEDIVFRVRLENPTNADLNNVRKTIESRLSGIGNITPVVNTKAADASVQRLTRNFNDATRAAKNFGDQVALSAKRNSAYLVAAGFIFKISNAFASATTSAIRFNKELGKLAQTFEIEIKDIDYRPILRIAEEFGVASTKVAELVKILGQAGFSFKEALKGAELLSRTSLLASFDDLTSTTEALIAVTETFGLSIDESAKAIESINLVSKKYAVESRDLVEAIKRTGGVFAATGGTVEELNALITKVRSTTRESAETIATGFRTIFSRLQRPKTIEYFRQLQIELVNTKNEFVGNYEAIRRISEGLQRLQINPGTVKFAEVVEQIGDVRQVSRVIPLITDFTRTQEIFGVATRESTDSLIDAAKAQETLANRIEQLRQKFASLIFEITNSSTFQVFINYMLKAADVVLDLSNRLTYLIPLISGVVSGRVLGSVVKALGNRGVSIKDTIGFFNDGGFVPGRGDKDTVPAMLTPGEFVINKSSARAYGYGRLQKINKYAKGGKVHKFASGGEVPFTGQESSRLDTLIKVIEEALSQTETRADRQNAPDLLEAGRISIKSYSKETQDFLKKNKDLIDEAKALYEQFNASLGEKQTFEEEKKQRASTGVFDNNRSEVEAAIKRDKQALSLVKNDKAGAREKSALEASIKKNQEILSSLPAQQVKQKEFGIGKIKPSESPVKFANTLIKSIEQQLQNAGVTISDTIKEKIGALRTAAGEAESIRDLDTETSSLSFAKREALAGSSSITRGFGDKVTSLDQAEKVVQEFVQTLAPVLDKIPNINLKNLEEFYASQGIDSKKLDSLRGKYVKDRGQENVLLNLNKATESTVRHEVSHKLDADLGGGKQFASTQSGTFQNSVTELIKPKIVSDAQAAGKTPEKVNYLSKNEEIFADLLSKSDPEIAKILVSTTDAATGMEKLKEHISKVEYIMGFAPQLFADLQKKVTDTNKLVIPEAGNRRPVDRTNVFGSGGFGSYIKGQSVGSKSNLVNVNQLGPSFGPSKSDFLNAKNASFGAFRPRVDTGFGGFNNLSGPQKAPVTDDIDSLVEEALNSVSVKEKTEKAAKKGGCCNKVLSYLSRILQSMKGVKGASKVSTSVASSGPTSTSVVDTPVTTAPNGRGGIDITTVAIAASLFSQTITSFTEDLAGTDSAITRVVDQLTSLGATISAVVATLSALGVPLSGDTIKDLFSGKLEKGLFSKLPSLSQQRVIPNQFTDGAFGVKTPKTAKTYFPTARKALDQLPSFNLPKVKVPGSKIAGEIFSPFINQFKDLGKSIKLPKVPNLGVADKARGFYNEAVSPITGRLPKLPKLPKIGLPKASGLGVGALGAAAAGGIVTSLIDAGRGFTANKEKAIQEGRIGDAGNAAVTEALQKDLSGLSVGILGVSALFGPLGLAVGVATVGVLKFGDQIPIIGDYIKSASIGLRDFAASLGLASSTTRIEAEARAKAADEAFSNTFDRQSGQLKDRVKNIGRGEKLDDIASGPQIQAIAQAFQAKLNENANARNIARDEELNNNGVMRTVQSNLRGLGSLFTLGFVQTEQQRVEGLNADLDQNKKAEKELAIQNIDTVRPLLEALSDRFVRSGGVGKDEFFKTLPPALRQVLEQGNQLGAGGNKVLEDIIRKSQFESVIGSFNDALKLATEATLDFQNSLFDNKVNQIGREFDIRSLSPTSGIQDIRDRQTAVRGLISGNPEARGEKLADLATKRNRILQTREDIRTETQKGDVAKLESLIKIEEQGIKQNIEARKLLIDIMKKEIEVERQRVSAISSSLTEYATGDRAQRKQIERTARVTELLQGIASGKGNISDLTTRQRGLVPAAVKNLTAPEQENINRQLEKFGAAGLAQRVQLTGQFGAGVNEVAQTGTTKPLTSLINNVRSETGLLNQDENALTNKLKLEAEFFNTEFNKINQQLEKVLNENKLIDAANILNNLQPLKIEFPTQFTVDVAGNNELLEALYNQTLTVVAQEIEKLKMGAN